MRKLILIEMLLLVSKFKGSYALNGRVAKDGQFPYQVQVYGTRGTHERHCSGAILDQFTIITAAHCLIKRNINSTYILVGSLQRKRGLKHKISLKFTHNNYHRSQRLHDIGMIKLSTPLQFTSNVAPVILSRTPIINGDNLTISGWGNSADYLLFSSLKGLLATPCRDVEKGRPSFYIRASNICGVCNTCNITTCNGDSGAPVVNRLGELVGVHVRHTKPCDSGNPSVFSSVNYYYEWIMSNMGVGKIVNAVEIP